MSKFLRCPKDHKVGAPGPFGTCTPLVCAHQVQKKAKVKRDGHRDLSPVAKGKRPLTKKTEAAIEEMTPKADALIKAEQERSPERPPVTFDDILAKAKEEMLERMAISQVQFGVKAAASGLPAGLKGSEAEAWADSKLAELLPIAVAEYEYQLKHGTMKERGEAAAAVMNANGRGKREQGGNHGPSILIVTAPGTTFEKPWRKKPAVVEGEVILPSNVDGVSA